MNTSEDESRTRAQKALWHVDEASRLLKSLDTRFEPTSALSPPPLSPAALPPELSPLERLESNGLLPGPFLLVLQQRLIEQVRNGDFLTNDVVEICGRLGTDDHRALRINGGPSLKLDRREHAVLLILYHFALHVAETSRGVEKLRAAFLPVNSILAIVLKLTADGGLLAGRWPYPIETDIYKCVNKLRHRVEGAGLNPNLMESARHRGAGYRISTPVNNLILNSGQEPTERLFWRNLFDQVVSLPGEVQGMHSGEESPSC